MPGTPISGVSTGPATSESANVAPIVMPMTAIARVRTDVAREIGGERDHGGGDGARALHGASDDRPADRRAPTRR